mgnify:CR=1 FL=1
MGEKTSRTTNFVALILFGLLSLASFVVATLWHEPWRDEAQAFLIAIQHWAPWNLLAALRFEGHPPLLHWLYQLIFAATGSATTTLALVASAGYFLLCWGTYALLKNFSTAPFALLAAFLLATTSNYFYEFGVISRGYGMGLGAAFLTAALLFQQHQQPTAPMSWSWLLPASGGILASIHTASLTCWFLAVSLPFLFTGKRKSRHNWHCFWPVLTLIIPISLTVLVGISHPDRAVTEAPVNAQNLWRALWQTPPDFLAVFTPEALTRDYWESRKWFWGAVWADAMYPKNWWPTPNFLSQPYSPERRVPLLLFLLGLCFIGATVKSANSRNRTLLGFAIAAMGHWLVLGGLLKMFYGPQFRHSLVLTLPALLFIGCSGLWWLSQSAHWSRKVIAGLSILVLCNWLWFQWLGLVANLTYEIRYPFSQTKAIAATLTEGTAVITEKDYFLSAMKVHRPSLTLHAIELAGEPYSYVKWDRARSATQPLSVTAQQICTTGRPVTLALRGALPAEMQKCSHHQPQKPIAVPSTTGEYFQVFDVDCSCLQGAAVGEKP